MSEPPKAPRAFEGLKVVDFTWVGVGPITIKYLADNGATAIHIESHTRPDTLRMGGGFKDRVPGIDRGQFMANFNSSKLGISLNLDQPAGRELAWRLIGWADVVAESYTPHAMAKWGLSYQDVRRVRPDIVYFSTCVQGHTGPRKDYRGFGSVLAAGAGFHQVTGWPDRLPQPPFGAYTDFICPRLAAASLMAALDYRRRTGIGQYVEQSQFETALHFLAPALLDYTANGRVAGRNGNRHPVMAPHGVFPCAGEDKWVAITVASDEEWRRLCQALGHPQAAADARFATALARKQHEDELEALLGSWTAGYSPDEAMALLQDAGVMGAAVRSVADLFADPQLSHRGHFQLLQHAVMGEVLYDGPAFKLSKTPPRLAAAPALGQHNEQVYKEVLGLGDDEIAELLVQGVITTEGDLAPQ